MEFVLGYIFAGLGLMVLIFTLKREQEQHLPKLMSEPRNDAELLREIRQLLSQSRKIEAIKLARKYKKMDLYNAKRWVESLDQQVTIGQTTPNSFGVTSISSGQLTIAEITAKLPPDIKAKFEELSRAERKLDAIQLLRTHAGLGLKEAKELIDVYFETLARTSNSPKSNRMYNEAVKSLLKQGKKIEALKALRAQTGLGLQEAIQVLQNIENEMR